MKKILILAIALAGISVIGCSGKQEGPQAAKAGDYDGPPGGAKTPEAGSPAPK
jgi:hypothetical protein